MMRVRSLHPMARRAPGAMLALLGLGAAACGGKEGTEPNALPSAPPLGTSTSSSTSTGADGVSTTPDPETGSGTGDPALVFPRAYRFECIDIQILGDGDGDTAQARILQGAWSADIAKARLNILLTVVERDEEAGTAMLQVSSGVGDSPNALCDQPDSISAVYPAGYEVGVATWADGRDEGDGQCSQEGGGTDGVGTYSFSTTADDVVYIHAEDDDGTTFNCVPGGRKPDAVPIRAIQATLTVAPGESLGFGSLTGCLTQREAMELCSCIGSCGAAAVSECAGCPDGSRSLAGLLTGINPSPRCTDLTGEDAFDLQLGMTTKALGARPEPCR